jgi:hypothetical protein
VAERIKECREASTEREAGVVFRWITKRLLRDVSRCRNHPSKLLCKARCHDMSSSELGHHLDERPRAFDRPTLQAKLADYMHEVDRGAERIQRLEKAIDEAVATGPESIRSKTYGTRKEQTPGHHRPRPRAARLCVGNKTNSAFPIRGRPN